MKKGCYEFLRGNHVIHLVAVAKQFAGPNLPAASVELTTSWANLAITEVKEPLPQRRSCRDSHVPGEELNGKVENDCQTHGARFSQDNKYNHVY